METKSGNVAELFNDLGYPYTSLEIGEEVDVSDKKVSVRTFNLAKESDDWKPISKIVRKEDSNEYIIKCGDFNLSCSKDHKIAVATEPSLNKIVFIDVKSLLESSKDHVAFTSAGFLPFTIEKTGLKIPILDFEVGETHCYFSNGFLSHNTFYGSNETTPGGNAMKFAASVRIKITRASIKKGDEVVGSTVKARIEKNKVAVPLRVCEMEIIFNEGINKMSELVDLGVQFGFVTKRGAFYSIDETRLGQGKDAAKTFLKENKELAEKLEAQIRNHMSKTQTGLVLDSGDDEIEVDEETGEIL